MKRGYLYTVIGIVLAAIFGLAVGLKVASPIVVETVDIETLDILEGKVDALRDCMCGAQVECIEYIEYISVPYTETVIETVVVTDCNVTVITATGVPVSTTPTTTATSLRATPTSTTVPSTETSVPPTSTPTCIATSVPTTTPEPAPKPKCNQGRGNGSEGCSPGKSDSTVRSGHPKGPNDEPPSKGKRQ